MIMHLDLNIVFTNWSESCSETEVVNHDEITRFN